MSLAEFVSSGSTAAWLPALDIMLKATLVLVVASLITLALAIGANTAIFSVYNALLVRALPFPESDRLVQVARGYPDGVGDPVAIPKYLRWRDGSGAVFRGIAAYDPRIPIGTTGTPYCAAR